MSTERDGRITSLFHDLVDITPSSRAAALEARCAGDPALRQQLASLLSAHDHVSTIFGRLDRPWDDPAGARKATEAVPELPRHPRYRVTRELGRGGMGIVYLATDVELDRPVALKLLSTAVDRSAPRDRLLGEARAAGMLDHPNVATIYDVGETDEGRLFMAMAYCPGESLRQRLGRGPLPIDEAVRIARQVADGLSAAHHHGLVHRDIKPANILFSAPGHVKIVDFGIAERIDPERTRAAEITGTMAYMAPEQARGEPVGATADLWALGVVLFEMLSGTRPFAAESPLALLHAILHDPPGRLPPAVLRDAPDLQRIVDRALQKDRTRRYSTAEELSRDLLSAVANGAERATPRLPAYLTTFVGRARERSAARAALQASRLVTLTGAPGTGKTRLAVQLASELAAAYPDGVVFVPLAAIDDAQLVPSAIAQALGLHSFGSVPAGDAIIRTIAARCMLLVLDNFEQVLPAAPLVAALAAACPRLTLLVTSRASLRVSGEREVPVPPFDCPADLANQPLEAIAENQAVALFLQRAAAIQPSLALDAHSAPAVAAICRRLDGLPLAIELAAARVKLLPPGAILARLERRLDLLKGGARDLPSRHQTLREAIGWSYGLLVSAEKRLLRRLSVCAGGFTLAAAEHIGDTGDDIELLDGLATLVDNNLLHRDETAPGEPRFRMLETIREFSLECLRAAGEEAEARRAHLTFCLGVLEGASARLAGPEQAAGLDELEREHDNLRGACDWAVASGDAEGAARASAGLWRFWLMRGHLREGRERLARALGMVDRRSRHRLPLLTADGSLAHNLGAYDESRARFQEAVELARALADARAAAAALNDLGWVAWRQGRYDEARSISLESLALHRQLGDVTGVAHALNNLGWVAHHQGDYAAAEGFHRESLDHREAAGDPRAVAFSLVNLAWALGRQREVEAALPLLARAHALLRKLGEAQLSAFAGFVLAICHLEARRPTEALGVLEDSARIFRRIDDRFGVAASACAAAMAAADLGDLERARAGAEESLALRREIGDRWGTAESLALQARLAESDGRRGQAVRLWREALTIWSALGDTTSAAVCRIRLAASGDPPTTDG